MMRNDSLPWKYPVTVAATNIRRTEQNAAMSTPLLLAYRATMRQVASPAATPWRTVANRQNVTAARRRGRSCLECSTSWASTQGRAAPAMVPQMRSRAEMDPTSANSRVGSSQRMMRV